MEVRDDIPIPEVRRLGATPKYPWSTMEVGQSKSFSTDEEFERARRAAVSAGQRYNKRFTSRAGWIDGEFVGKGGTVWREADK